MWRFEIAHTSVTSSTQLAIKSGCKHRWDTIQVSKCKGATVTCGMATGYRRPEKSGVPQE